MTNAVIVSENLKAIISTNNPIKLVTYSKSNIVGGGGAWGSITGTLSAQTDLQNALDLKQNIGSDIQLGNGVYLDAPASNTFDISIFSNALVRVAGYTSFRLKDTMKLEWGTTHADSGSADTSIGRIAPAMLGTDGITYNSTSIQVDSADNTKTVTRDLSSIPTATDITITEPSFNFNFNDYFPDSTHFVVNNLTYGNQTTATVGVGDSAHGFFLKANDNLVMLTNGFSRFQITGTTFSGSLNSSAGLINETPSYTNPTVLPRSNTPTTGVGGVLHDVSLICDSAEILRAESTGVNITGTLDLFNTADPTKQTIIDNSSLTTASIRTLVMPDFDYNFNDYFDGLGGIKTNTPDIGDDDYLLRLQENSDDKFYVKARDGAYLSMGSSRYFTIARDGLTGFQMGFNGTSPRLHIGSAGTIDWNPNTLVSGLPDTGLLRSSAGVLKVTDGSTGEGDLEVKKLTTSNNLYIGNTSVYFRPFSTQSLGLYVSAGHRFTFDTQGFKLSPSGEIVWGSVDANSVADTGLTRKSAGTLKVTDGSTGSGAIQDLNLVDSTDPTKKTIINNSSLTTASTRALTMPDFDYNFNDYFDGLGDIVIPRTDNDGTLYFGTNKETRIKGFADIALEYVIGGRERHTMTTSAFNLASSIAMGWSDSTLNTTTIDTGIARKEAGVVGIEDGVGGQGELNANAISLNSADNQSAQRIWNYNDSGIVFNPAIAGRIGMTNTAMNLGSSMTFNWHSSSEITNVYQTVDTGIDRRSAGLLRITLGGTSGYGGIEVSSLGKMVDVADNTKTVSRDLTAITTATDIVITEPNFDFNYNDYFESTGQKLSLSNNITLINSASNRLDIATGGSETVQYRFNSSIALEINTSTKITWGTGDATTAQDTTIERKEAGVVGVQTLNMSSIPTASAGLASGDVWSDAGTLKIVT